MFDTFLGMVCAQKNWFGIRKKICMTDKRFDCHQQNDRMLIISNIRLNTFDQIECLSSKEKRAGMEPWGMSQNVDVVRRVVISIGLRMVTEGWRLTTYC